VKLLQPKNGAVTLTSVAYLVKLYRVTVLRSDLSHFRLKVIGIGFGGGRRGLP
jgi:hypothetical protein